MLRRFQIARLAYDHSPEKEQRLLAFAGTGTPDPNAAGGAEEDDAAEENSAPEPEAKDDKFGDMTLSSRQRFHNAVFNAVDLETQQKVLADYLPDIKNKIKEDVDVATLSPNELGNILERTRTSILEDLDRETVERNQLATALGDIDTDTVTDAELTNLINAHRPMIERYFVLPHTLPSHSIVNLLQALLAKDIERMRRQKHKVETGVTWNYLYSEQFEALYRKLQKIPPTKKNVPMPNSFSYGNTMVFNIEHEDFKKEGIGKKLAERAMLHSAANLALANAEPRFGIGIWTRMLKQHPKWKELSQAIENVYGGDSNYLKGTKKQENIASAALSIYLVNKKSPLDTSTIASNPSIDAQVRVHKIMDEIFADPQTGHFDTLRQQLEGTVDRYLEVEKRNDSEDAPLSVASLLLQASKDAKIQKELLQDLEIDRQGLENVGVNPDQGVGIAQRRLANAAAEAESLTAEEISAKIDILLSKLQKLRERYPALQAIIEKAKMEAETRAQHLAIVNQNLEYMDDSGTKLLSLKRRADILNRWNLPEAEGGLSVDDKSRFAEAEGFANHYRHLQTTVEAADALSADSCQNTLNEVRELMSVYEPIFKEMEEEIDKAEEGDKGHTEDAGGEKETVGAWLKKNVFSSQGDVVWLTPLNIMHIIKTYKDAITQNYNSNQRVKENKVAKQINFYTPIQHTLNKLARSTNNTETSEFKEYIEREGFTFNQVFGTDGTGKNGGLLFQNKHNFNRAKAVLEYAADKAWMYTLDPLNGHNVYGIDYEAIEGHQAFEDLVQKHESGKSHEIQHGYDRVDKYPDVVPIINTMMHELHQKNIFAVQGIMKRLQEKAKYSHSNTWMLTTLLMSMRDHPELKICFDKGMIDNISNFTISQSAWSVTWLKVLRNKMMDFKNDKVEFGSDILTGTMVKIEKRLEREGVHFPPDPEGEKLKHEAIGIILAGKTYRKGTKRVNEKYLPLHPISIFDDEFNDYREKYSDAASSSTEPKNTDDDYWNADNGGADILLLGKIPTVDIIDRKSTGTFENRLQARGFFAQVFDRYEDLTTEAAKATDSLTRRRILKSRQNFILEMKEKLLDERTRTGWIYGQVLGNTPSLKQFTSETDTRNRSILEQLLRVGILSQTTYDEIKNGSDRENKVGRFAPP